MVFNSLERDGVFVIIVLIAGILILPQQVLPKETDLFLLTKPIEVEIDSIESMRTTELNSADSAMLVEIKGIGPYYASRIIRYRERLGGFYSIKQLKDLKMKYFDVDSNAHLFSINPALIRQVDMDTMSFKAVLRHPYLEYEDVQMIFNAKRKYGRLSYALLEEKGILPAYILKKIKPYFK